MSNQEATTEKRKKERLSPTERLPYRRPALVEYGSVAKLTEGSIGSRHDNSALGSMTCL
nr:hypothetical protein Hi04_10k_c5966_00030 [uncultured bacterium]